ncbi:MAG TPA: DNA modification methylase [bacterium]|nr:DNA modification methylase [bacterium]
MLNVQEIDPAQLHVWEENPRINDHAVDAVAKSIKQFGFNVPILCDQNHMIVAGHTRWKAAQKLGLRTVPVIQLEMTEAQRKAFAVADNKTAELADWDWPKLRDVFAELQKEDVDLQDLGFSNEELNRILDPDFDENQISLINTSSKINIGDLFQLGQHRLICGDASEDNIWQQIIPNTAIDLIIASPPRFNNLGLGKWGNISEYLSDIERVVQNLGNKLSPGGIVHWNIGNPSNLNTNLAIKHANFFESVGLQYLEMLFLSRPYAAFSTKRNVQIQKNGYYYPAHQCNPIWVYQKRGKMPKMTREGKNYMSNFPTDFWEINYVANQMKKLGHPGVTPVELPYRAIQAYSSKNSLIVDPFAGTGTTLIATEKAGQGRIANLIEINPVYCEIIIDRWQKYTGNKAEFIGNSKAC